MKAKTCTLVTAEDDKCLQRNYGLGVNPGYEMQPVICREFVILKTSHSN